MKEYLGDSVYAQVDPLGRIVLTTENGLGPSNTIVLEPEVLEEFLGYVRNLQPTEDTPGTELKAP